MSRCNGLSYGYDIKPIPSSQRKYDFIDNFAIWFGAGISIAEFWAGAILVASPISLDLKLALIAIIVGHIIGNLLLSMVGVIGVETGLPTMVISRKPLGLRGSYLVSILNYLQLIGWTAVMLIVGALAMNNVSMSLAGINLYGLWVILLGILVTLWSLIGPEKWRLLEKIAAILLLVLSVWLAYVVLESYAVSDLLSGPLVLTPSFWLGLDLVIAMPVSWAPLIADYTRFSRRVSDGFWGSYIGYFVSSSLFYFLGAVSNIVAGEMDPISIIAFYGLGVPAMLIIVFSTVTTTFLDVYSAAITFKNIRPQADARKQITFVGILGTLIALVFPIHEYEWFLILIGGAFVSLTALMITDFIIDKKSYDPQKILDPGILVDWGSIIVWAIGFTVYILLAAPGLIPGLYIPFFSELGAVVGSSIPTLIIVSIIYTLYRLYRGRTP
ncbi:putative hydroxymethylpyrimidine transporter CytX [Desulfurococcaceae archaeon MEX13E-LK6-19]|nr:putative hydroxymethylpyrimidine transporter CytX [Desulfurococcaceae archaeon MEX13E-LK6-19]